MERKIVYYGFDDFSSLQEDSINETYSTEIEIIGYRKKDKIYVPNGKDILNNIYDNLYDMGLYG